MKCLLRDHQTRFDMTIESMVSIAVRLVWLGRRLSVLLKKLTIRGRWGVSSAPSKPAYSKAVCCTGRYRLQHAISLTRADFRIVMRCFSYQSVSGLTKDTRFSFNFTQSAFKQDLMRFRQKYEYIDETSILRNICGKYIHQAW